MFVKVPPPIPGQLPVLFDSPIPSSPVQPELSPPLVGLLQPFSLEAFVLELQGLIFPQPQPEPAPEC